jgi:L-asparaginase / beta-aspartyl-peptidase
VIHGGAGTLFKGRLDPEREVLAREGLKAALIAGREALQHSALDAVEQAVRVLEDCPAFNAGRGAVYSHEGEQHMDAAIMSGQDRSAGAIAGVQRVQNPISLARKVLSHSPHVLLIGKGAEQFAREQQCVFAEDDYFHSDYRWQQLLAIRDQQTTALDHGLGLGTVGAVAIDGQGHLAAATSTGGMTNKRYGRVGDSPLIGCGTYADAFCAVSATGHGEFFIRSAFAYDIAARLRYAHLSLQEACEAALTTVAELGGGGGVIAIDSQGNFAMPFNTGRMYRGAVTCDDSPEIEIY